MTDHTPDPAHPCVERVPMHRLADGSYSDRCGEPSTDVEYGDEGRYVYHRPPFMGEHAQWLWRNGYAAGVASIEATECECSEEYGPCEDHSEVLAQREGASLRTAECVWCGRVARCSDAGTGDAMCEDCWHRMDWIIPDGPLLEEDGDR